jgi:DNA primase
MASGIPPETIEHIRSQADIVQVVSEYLTLKKAGANYKALCPFHREKTPSFMVSPSKQIYHCFGCGAGGNVFGFLMRQEGMTFPESVRFMAERLGIQIKQYEYAPEQRELREQLHDLYELATVFFHKCLLKSPEAEPARTYLKGRQLSKDAVKAFTVGYAPQGWDSLIKAASRKGFSKDLLLQGGLAKKSAEGRIYDAFRNRIIFPIWGLSGKVIAFGGRALGDDQPKYINSPETPIYQKGQVLYNLHRAKNSVSNNNAVIVVEGYTDVIRLVLNGVENVVASSGTAFTPAQARLIKRYASEVAFVFDRDSAGNEAARRGVEVLFSEDLDVKISDALPPGMDPDEFVQKNGAEPFRQIVDDAKLFLDFLVEKTLADWKKDGATESKIKTANMLASLIAKVPSENPVKRDEYLRLVASKLDLSPEALLKASQKSASADRIIEEDADHFQKKLRHEEKEYMWLIKLLVKKPEHVANVRENLDVDSVKNEPLRVLFEAIFNAGENSLEESALFDSIHDERAQQVLSHILFEDAGPESLYPIEWWTGFITSRQKEKTLGELVKKITEAEQKNDIKTLERLLRQKAEISRDLAAIKEEMMKVTVHSSAGSALSGR